MGSKGQGHRIPMIENGFWNILEPVLHLYSCNLPEMISMLHGWPLFILESKGQGQRSLILKNGFWTIFDSNCNYNHEACQKYLSWIKDDPSCFWSPKVKVVERRWLKKWFPDHIWVIISPIIRKLSKNYSLESECPLFILGSKGQRSRS